MGFECRRPPVCLMYDVEEIGMSGEWGLESVSMAVQIIRSTSAITHQTCHPYRNAFIVVTLKPP